MSILLVLLAIVGALIGMRYVSLNFDTMMKKNKEISEAVVTANHVRFVQQVIADDQLCIVTDFLDGIKGWETKRLTKPKVLKNTGRFVDYSGIGVESLEWPSTTYEINRPHTFADGRKVVGKAKVTGVIFIQPANVDPIRSEAHGKVYWRIPVHVKEVGTMNGESTIFEDSIETFIELDPDNPLTAPPVSCYKSVSARSLCMDAGGDFDPTAEANKCLMPGQSPSVRKGTNFRVRKGNFAPDGGGQKSGQGAQGPGQGVGGQR